VIWEISWFMYFFLFWFMISTISFHFTYFDLYLVKFEFGQGGIFVFVTHKPSNKMLALVTQFESCCTIPSLHMWEWSSTNSLASTYSVYYTIHTFINWFHCTFFFLFWRGGSLLVKKLAVIQCGWSKHLWPEYRCIRQAV
jgi:hypothetical protein